MNFIGKYEFGYEWVALYWENDTGGFFRLLPNAKGTAEICVGIKEDKWRYVLTTLAHESMELALTRLGCRYKPSQDMANSHDGYLFSMTHPVFSDVCAHATEFICASQSDLWKAWNDNKRKEKEMAKKVAEKKKPKSKKQKKQVIVTGKKKGK